MNDKVAPKSTDAPSPPRNRPAPSDPVSDPAPFLYDNQHAQSMLSTAPRPSFSDWMTQLGNPGICYAPGADPTATPEPPPKPAPVIKIDDAIPWHAFVNPEAGWPEISIELYGLDISPMIHVNEMASDFFAPDGMVCIDLYTELLAPKYAAEVHPKIEKSLFKDTDYVEDKLMETWVDDDDESSIMDRVKFWATASDIRDRDGESYFDRFLGKLEFDTCYTDYGVKKGASKTFLNLLHEEIEGDAGVLVNLLANKSERYGSYRPSTLFPSVSPETDKSQLTVNRVVDQLLDRMVGWTSGNDQNEIVGMMKSMPGDLQARVLKELMTRHKERTLWIFSRTGEQNEEGMLYFLFEDLDADDRKKMGDDLVAKGVLKQDAADALVARRTWAGRNLPWSTGLGKKAAQFWADEYNSTDSKAYGAVSATLGSFASLWTPETAGTTIVVLATANPSGVIGSTVARAPLIVQKGLMVAGTGFGAYTATTATMQAVAGEDSEGHEIHGAVRVAKAIEAVSGFLMLGAGFAGAAEMKPQLPPVAAETSLAPLGENSMMLPKTPMPSGEQRIAWRVMSETPDGEIMAVGINHETGEYGVVNINKHTGDGSFFSPKFGRTNIVAGEPQPMRNAIEGGAPAQGPGPIRVSPDMEVLPKGSPDVPKIAGPKPNSQIEGRSPYLLEDPYIDISGEIQQHINETFGVGDTAWQITADGTAFTVPPESLKPMPIYSPDGVAPPGEIFAGQPRQPVLVGRIREGFSPFEVFPPPNAPTELTLNQVRNYHGPVQNRGNVGRDFVAQQHGGEVEVGHPLPEQVTLGGQQDITQGVRETDALAPGLPGHELNLEVKNYLRFINGPAHTFNQVAPNAQLRGEMWRDAMIPYYYPDQQPVWVFVGAPPSPQLAAELGQHGIPYMVYSDSLRYMGGITIPP